MDQLKDLKLKNATNVFNSRVKVVVCFIPMSSENHITYNIHQTLIFL